MTCNYNRNNQTKSWIDFIYVFFLISFRKNYLKNMDFQESNTWN